MQKKSTFIEQLEKEPHSCWKEFIGITSDLIIDIEKEITNETEQYTPLDKWVLRFLNLDISKIKVVILGQDPYPQPGIATGRAFEVGTLKSWHDKFNNISLKNIVRAIYYAYYGEHLKYVEIKQKIVDFPQLFESDIFNILPPNILFKNWEEQGVLLLNTAFTCNIGEPGSHGSIWSGFTNKLLNYLAEYNENLIWFLWGNDAQNITASISIKNRYTSMHPMMCYKNAKRTDDFLYGKINHFEKTKHLVNWLGNIK